MAPTRKLRPRIPPGSRLVSTPTPRAGPPDRPARSAILAAENVVRTHARASAPKTDGRKQRWRTHKIARRAELIDGTLAAIRRHGAAIGMDEIAADIGVSKTVLYRYFADKGDLIRTTTDRYVETTLAPRVYAAIAEGTSEYELVRSAIAAYVETVAADPEVYLFVMGSGGAELDAVSETQRMFAGVVAAALIHRMHERQIDAAGATPWSYAIIGAIQLATHWWITDRSLTAERLIDYLTMMVWGAIEGIARDGGSAERFAARAHGLPELGVEAAE